MTTVYEFELPRGYQDPSGAVHKKGKMRLATAGDELTAARDPRVLNNPSYLTIVLLSKVIIELEGIDTISGNMMEQLYTADLTFLQDMYEKINAVDLPAMHVVCPHCGEEHEVLLIFTREG
ncbi:MAG: phage tail assembly protein [Ruminococcus sp.]|nr:phage tail assembly protein [Ruminococcus sp.]